MLERILSLADDAASSDKAKAKAAKLAMAHFVHTAAAPGAPKELKMVAIADLLAILRAPRPRLVRAQAAYLLGLIGGAKEEKALAPLERDPEIGEDVRMARQRIRRG